MIGSGGSESLSATAPSSHARKNVRLVGVERGFFQLDELIAAALEHDPLKSVGCDTDEALAFLTLAIGKIIRHSPNDIVPFLIEIALGLENGATDQRIETSSHLRNPALKIERSQLDAEFLDQELAKIRLHLIVPRAGGEMAQEVAGPRIVGQGFLDLRPIERSNSSTGVKIR